MGMLYDVFYQVRRGGSVWTDRAGFDPEVSSDYLNRITLKTNERAIARNINGDGHVITITLCPGKCFHDDAGKPHLVETRV